MARLGLTLLGGFRARLDDDRVVALPIKKAQALLAYLAIPLGQAHPRDKLAALLWGDMRAAQARAGLRQTLFVIRKTVGTTVTLPLEDETIALDPAVVAVDVGDFEQCVARGTPESLEMAASLYQGDLLEGLSLEEPPFEEWLIAERQRLLELAVEGLARLLAHQRDSGALDVAVQTALRLVALDPLQEPVHRTLMRLYAQLGRRGAALRQYQLCVAALQRELRTEPENETKTLYREILQRRVARPSASAPRAANPVEAPPADLPELSSPPPAETLLVGREVELGQLRDALQAAWAGQGQLVAVIGEAGIGKSCLAATLAVDAGRKGGRALVGRCYESEQVLAFGPWIDALRAGRVADESEILGKLGPVWRAELARLLPEIADAPPGATASEPAQLFEVIVQLLERMTLAQPMLLILEDLHWADQMSLRLLAFVGRRLQRWRMLAVVTAREEDFPDSTLLRHTVDELSQGGQVVRRHLGPLHREDTIALARTLMPARDAAFLEEQLWRASEGNPFMVVETVRALRGGPAPEGAPGLPLPERVRDLIVYRLERLGARSRALVAVAAVIGRPFDFALLQRAADLGEAEAADGVEELVRQRVLHSRGEILEFTHDRIREVVDGQLLPPRRALLHRRVAEALETLHVSALGPHALALGTHYREGHVWPKAVLYLTQAGTQASLRCAHRDAAVCYEQALAGLGHLTESGETQEHAADLRFRLAHSLFQVGEFERAKEGFREAETLALALGDHRRLGQVQAGMSYVLLFEGDFAGAIQTGRQALTIAASLGDLGLQVWTSIGLGRVYLSISDYPRAIERLRWVMDALEDVPVDERFGRGSLVPSVASRTYLAIALSHTGEFAEAIALGADAARIAEAVNSLQERAWAGYSLARVRVARGDVDEAIPLLEQAVSLCRDGRLPPYWPRVLATLGEAYTIQGRADLGLPLLEQARAEAQAIKLIFGHLWILMLTGAAYLEAGQIAEADRCASTALDLTRRNGARGDEAWSLHVLGRIAARKDPPDYDRALERSVEALTLAEEFGMAPLQARCHLSLGALHQRAGRAEEARRELTRAVEMLAAMQMRPWLRAAEALLATTR
jgi:DNA-binding SARP family transcriptional activator